MPECALTGQLHAVLSAFFRSAMVFIPPQALTHVEGMVCRPAFHTASEMRPRMQIVSCYLSSEMLTLWYLTAVAPDFMP